MARTRWVASALAAFAALLAASALPASVKPCRDAAGKIVRCAEAKPAPKRCKDAQGRSVRCPDPTSSEQAPAGPQQHPAPPR